MKNVWMLLGLGIAIGSLFENAEANTDCTSAKGDIVFRNHVYMGGARPPADFEVGRTEWVVSGTVLSREVRCTDPAPHSDGARNCPRDTEIHDPDLVARRIEGTERVLYESPKDEPWHHVLKYTVDARVLRPSGLPLPDGRVVAEDILLCELNQIFAP